MPNFTNAPNISTDINHPTSLDFAQTGYLRGYTPYTVYYQLPNATGTQEVSVLPDLVQIVYDATTAPLLGLPANTPILEQETSLSATIYRQVITNGNSSYLSFATLTGKEDTLAEHGRQTQPGSTIYFYDTTVTFAPQTTSTFGNTTTVYTSNYILAIDGQAVPDLVISSDPNQNFTPDAGRFLVTSGNPTGQRMANWGGWIDTYQFTSATTTQTSGEAAPPLNTHVSISSVPTGAGFQAPTSITVSLMDASTRPWHLDIVTGLWSAPAFGGLGATSLAFLGKGVSALVAGASDEISEQIHKFVEAAAKGAGLEYLSEVANQIQSASQLHTTINSWATDMMNHLEADISSFGFGSLNLGTSEAYYESRSQQYESDLRSQAKTGESGADSWFSRFVQSIDILQHDSDPVVQLHIDMNSQHALVASPAGHYDFILGSSGNDSFALGSNGGFVFAGNGNDTIKVGNGTDYIDGGTGFDTVVIPVTFSTASVVKNADSTISITTALGQDILHGVESVQFSDRNYSLVPSALSDFNNDGSSDVLFVNSVTHDADSWTIVNGKWAGSSDLGSHPSLGWQVGGIGDFNADGNKDVLWFNQATGETDTWLLQNGHWAASVSFGTHPGTSSIAGVGDFNGDGITDVLWFDQGTGKVDEWKISNGKWAGSVDIGAHPGSGWTVGGTGDYNGDHTSDVLWVNAATGATDIWEFKNGNWLASVSPGTHSPSSTIVGTGDFNGDGTSDMLWLNPSNGDLDLWKITNGQWAGSVDLGAHPGAGWHVAGTGDYNADGNSDVLWSNSNTGENDIWLIQNGHWAASVNPGTHAAADWVIPHQT